MSDRWAVATVILIVVAVFACAIGVGVLRAPEHAKAQAAIWEDGYQAGQDGTNPEACPWLPNWHDADNRKRWMQAYLEGRRARK